MMTSSLSDSIIKSSIPEKTQDAKNALGKEAFLQLLVMQLQNQDPLKPMDDKEFITQLAQFSSLEEMKNISKSIDGLVASQSTSSKTDAVGFIGKEIKTTDGPIGTVTSIAYESGVPYLMVGSVKVPLGDVTEVR